MRLLPHGAWCETIHPQRMVRGDSPTAHGARPSLRRWRGPAKVPRIEADAPASALGLLDDCHGRDKDVAGEAAPARPGDGPFDGQECPLVRARLLRALYPNYPTDASQRRAPLEAAPPAPPSAQAAFPATSYYKSPPLADWHVPGQVLPPHPLYDYTR